MPKRWYRLNTAGVERRVSVALSDRDHRFVIAAVAITMTAALSRIAIEQEQEEIITGSVLIEQLPAIDDAS